jgi:hypothetical protein
MRNLSLIALLLLSACADAQQTGGNQPPAKTFAGLYFSPTSGKVGYHMVSKNLVSQDPCSGNFSIGDYGSRGPGFSVEGLVPPGLTAPDAAKKQFAFEGTPRQAGDWDVKVTMRYIHCGYGGGAKDTDPDLSTDVHFHIDP